MFIMFYNRIIDKKKKNRKVYDRSNRAEWYFLSFKIGGKN